MRTIKDKYSDKLFNKRYHLKESSILISFLGFFEMQNVRYSEFENYILTRSEFEIDNSDWEVISNDFRNVIIRHKEFELTLNKEENEVNSTQNTLPCVK